MKFNKFKLKFHIKIYCAQFCLIMKDYPLVEDHLFIFRQIYYSSGSLLVSPKMGDSIRDGHGS